jgi:hypothetical protein
LGDLLIGYRLIEELLLRNDEITEWRLPLSFPKPPKNNLSQASGF